ncbi:serine acetyltransferase [Baekduia soli]|uniref:Serine acetyltransferase n=2 Tax=Baekduia soli TaxID=496014 RepID=A0A5B8U0Z7_9ACTN|nr:serine acetyltransferase [Baekduia soli]
MSGTSALVALRADVRRYAPRELLTEPALWAIAVYRLGRFTLELPRPVRLALFPVYGALHLAVSLLTGISIPKSAEIGPGLRIFHFGGIIIHPASRMGANVTMGHGVTLGVREHRDGAPVIEDDVVLSAYAQVLGGVRVGRGAKVGAMTVVLDDVPAGATVAGIPARVVGRRDRTADPAEQF